MCKNIVSFPEPRDMGSRDWGEETLLAVVSGAFTFKRLLLKAGAKGGLQYHHKKEECGLLVRGKLLIRYDDGTGRLVEKVVSEGAVFHFPVGAVHQEEAISDCEIIEVSTPFVNDRVRVEERYGLKSTGGLPSTSIEDVVEL
jgi:mannose-6-phosphate isomerase